MKIDSRRRVDERLTCDAVRLGARSPPICAGYDEGSRGAPWTLTRFVGDGPNVFRYTVRYGRNGCALGKRDRSAPTATAGVLRSDGRGGTRP